MRRLGGFLPILGIAACMALGPAAALAQVVPASPEFRISPPAPESQVLPALAAAPDGGFLAVWQMGAGQPLSLPAPRILVRRFGVTGASEGDPVQVNTSPVNRNFDRPSLAVKPPGLALVVWQGVHDEDTGQLPPAFSSVFGRFVDTSGTPLGREFEIAANGRRPRVAALQGGGFAVVWESASPDLSRIEVLGSIVHPAGDVGAAAPVFRINQRRGFNFQGEPAIAADAGGRFVVVWTRSNLRSTVEIAGRLFNSVGEPLGGDLVLASGSSVQQPAVSFAPDGGFMVVWQRLGVIFGARFHASGRPWGAAFPIAAAPGETRIEPVIASDAEGRSVVAWSSSRWPAAIAQAFDASGRPIGGHFRLSRRRLVFGSGVQLAFLADGRLVAAWARFTTPGGPVGVFGSLFELP